MYKLNPNLKLSITNSNLNKWRDNMLPSKKEILGKIIAALGDTGREAFYY